MSAALQDDARRTDRAEAPPLLMEGLSAGFGARMVLTGVSLAVAAGAVTVLLGPNGAGKTTLLRAVCGRLEARHGTVRICGVDAEEAAARRLIGLAPQEIALYRPLTIRENLETFARLAGVPWRGLSARVGEVMARAGIAERAGERIDRLSGGWQRRANVAAALVGAPRLLVLDEPTVGIDAQAREDLAALVQRLAADGLAILLVTHDFAFAERVADRAAILKAGRLILEGGLADLLAARFKGRRMAEVTFGTVPDGARKAALATLGLAPADEPDLYCGLVADDPHAAAALIAALDAMGAAPRALALKAAGLEALYALAMREAAP
ncbi:ABC transporter ATP-binding protein [Xanthobacter pseudotagetidis]|uniref:ABC transporter ATP-binding protein n=1 Tax=Xanthobacter pseudotagetidis TaxID=3119911 RepID=UPI00372A7893